MINVKNIIVGWRNFIDKSEVVEELAIKRAEVCSNCEYAVKGKLLVFLKDSLGEIEGYKCTDCGGCPLSAKVRSLEKCRKWEN